MKKKVLVVAVIHRVVEIDTDEEPTLSPEEKKEAQKQTGFVRNKNDKYFSLDFFKQQSK